ncbi:MAG: 4-hydroxythreonine-4-phosphate dehydrogenase PdxA [Anaerolineae bacterium]
MTNKRPVLGITMGDPAGVGPEVIARALDRPDVWDVCRPVVVGDARWMEEATRIVGAQRPVRIIETVAEVGTGESLDVLDLANVDPARLQRGRVSAEGGRAAADYIQRAVHLALEGQTAAVVTAPINKEALHAAGVPYAGHTEMLAALCGAKDVAMMLVAGRLRVSHISTHLSLRQALERVSVERITRVARLTCEALARMRIGAPRLAVAGLNPHASDGGLFGDEEMEIIRPAIEALQREGIDVTGPYPPDSIFLRASQGEFDAVIAMYHDQGHIPVKLLGFYEGVNVTLGLPIIRTSVDHGTAFDIVGTGRADERSLVAALRLAAQMGQDG